MPKKDFGKLSGQFAGSTDDELARQQDEQLEQSMGILAERQRERLIRQAEQMGLVLSDGAELQAQIQQLQSELEQARSQQDSGASVVSLSSNKIQFTRVGAVVNGLNASDWLIVMNQLKAIQQAFAWVVGDMLVYATAQKWGEIESIYKEASENLDVSVGTLQNWASVSRNIEISRRRENLSLSHHIEVQGLSPDWQIFLLEQTETRKLSRVQLRQVVTLIDTASDINVILDQVQSMKKKADKVSLLHQSQITMRAAVLSGFAKKKERQRWLDFAEQQANEWSRLLNELKRQ